MLQNLSREIRDCYGRAEECKRLAAIALTDDIKAGFLDMERRWLLARSYEFAERLSSFTRRSAKPNSGKRRPLGSAPPRIGTNRFGCS
jgi:hypothetical protein